MQKVIDIFNRLPLPVTPDPSPSETAPELPKAADSASPAPPSGCDSPASTTSPPAATGTPNANWPSDRAMVTLWTRLEEIYPHRWSSKLGLPGPANSAFDTWRKGLAGLTPADLARGLERCIRERADPWPPTLPEFRQLCQPTPEEVGLPTVEEAYRVACLQKPDWQNVHPIVWHARQAVGMFELISDPSSRTRPHFEAAYQALVRRALAGERFLFPAELNAPALPNQSQPLAEEERAEAQRWALELSRIDDPEARQATLATAPVHWQATIRHYLAWRLGMAALRATLRKSEPSTGIK